MKGPLLALTDCHMREKSVEIPLKSGPNLTYFKKYVFLYVSNTKFNLLILTETLFVYWSQWHAFKFHLLTEVPD